MASITYEDKDKTLPVGVPRHQVRDIDMNEIKDVVNENYADFVAAINSDPDFAATVLAALNGKQPIDSNLTSIAGLSPSNDDLIQRKAGAWINRTLAQIKSDLSLNLVDNTADADKEISTPQQTALDFKAPLASPIFTTLITTPLIKVTSGSPGAGKVMTSDADGDGSWATPSVAVANITGTLGIANGGNGTTNGISAETQAALNLKTTNTQFAYKVTLIGTQDGDGIPGGSGNLIFTVGEIMVAGTDQVFRNGQLQTEGENYTITGYATTPTITFALAPESWETLRINFIRP